jgi:acyl carrier protein
VPDTHQRDEVIGHLRQIVADILKVPADAITTDSKLTDLAHVESIKLLRIAGKIERRFEIELDNEAMFREATLGDIADEVTALQRVG